jgi:hypothetical protein
VNLIAEEKMLSPARGLFSPAEYWATPEAPFGRKRIDLLLIPRHDIQWIAIELKVRDWKRALWQAAINAQLVDRSFVALWHTSIKAAEKELALFRHYGVGLIVVQGRDASIVADWGRSADTPVKRAAKAHYLAQGTNTKLSNASRHRALSLLSA